MMEAAQELGMGQSRSPQASSLTRTPEKCTRGSGLWALPHGSACLKRSHWGGTWNPEAPEREDRRDSCPRGHSNFLYQTLL